MMAVTTDVTGRVLTHWVLDVIVVVRGFTLIHRPLEGPCVCVVLQPTSHSLKISLSTNIPHYRVLRSHKSERCASWAYNSIYTIILLSLSVALIFGLYRPSSGPIALRNVLKCSTRHTFFTIRFWHFSSAAFIEKNAKNSVCAFNPIGVATALRQTN